MNRRPTTVRVGAAALSSVALMTTLSACGGAASGESAELVSAIVSAPPRFASSAMATMSGLFPDCEMARQAEPASLSFAP